MKSKAGDLGGRLLSPPCQVPGGLPALKQNSTSPTPPTPPTNLTLPPARADELSSIRSPENLACSPVNFFLRYILRKWCHASNKPLSQR